MNVSSYTEFQQAYNRFFSPFSKKSRTVATAQLLLEGLNDVFLNQDRLQNMIQEMSRDWLQSIIDREQNIAHQVIPSRKTLLTP